jgi:hypothetical protein
MLSALLPLMKNGRISHYHDSRMLHVLMLCPASYKYKLAQLQISLFYMLAMVPVRSHQRLSRALHMSLRTTDCHLPFDQLLTRPHLLEQRRVSNDPGRVLNLTARLIQSCYNAHNRALHYVCQIRNAVERHATSPLVHYLNHTKPRLADKVV